MFNKSFNRVSTIQRIFDSYSAEKDLKKKKLRYTKQKKKWKLKVTTFCGETIALYYYSLPNYKLCPRNTTKPYIS